MPGRRGLLRFGLALVATVAVGLAALAATNLARQNQQQPGSRPPIAVTVAYSIEYRTLPGGEFSEVRVSEQGAECHTFDTSPLLYQACSLAMNTDPALIAADAQGRLNTEHTAALEAIVWRGRLSEGPDFCSRAGLLDENLRRCEDGVESAEYLVSDSGLEIRVPAGWR